MVKIRDRLVDLGGMYHIKNIACTGSKWLLVPYANVDSFRSWARPLLEMDNVAVWGETPSWDSEFGNKSILHRHVRSPSMPSVIESIGIAVPRGWVCHNTAELMEAREMMSNVDVILKPVRGAATGGRHIIANPDTKTLLEYDFPVGEVNLEQLLDVDRDDRGETISPAIHYMGQSMIGDMVDQGPDSVEKFWLDN